MSKGIRAIIVDDENDIVSVFSEYLSLKGIDVVANAHNGQEAYDLYKKLNPDVILLDVKMPDFDGFYAIEKIYEFDPDAKIIVITASITPSTELELRKANVSEVLFKPHEMDDVLTVIEKVTNKINA